MPRSKYDQNSACARLAQRFHRSEVHGFYHEKIRAFAAAGLGDPQCFQALTIGRDEEMWQRIWEVLLGTYLVDCGFEPKSPRDSPDFLIQNLGRSIWLEAVCPTPRGLPDEWVNGSFGGVTSFPTTALLLRWTQSIEEKKEKLEGNSRIKGYRRRGIVGNDDIYIIALNSGQLGLFPSEDGVSQMPLAVEATLGVGPLQVTVDTETKEFSEPHHTARFHIKKTENADVSTTSFLRPEYSGVSAILSSGTLFPYGIQQPMTLVHNPLATNPLPVGSIPVTREYTTSVDDTYVTISRVAT